MTLPPELNYLHRLPCPNPFQVLFYEGRHAATMADDTVLVVDPHEYEGAHRDD